MSAVWALIDSSGHSVPGLVGTSRIELGRTLLPGRYDPFRLHVSASYREMFERDLTRFLAQNGWQIARVKRRRRAPALASDLAHYREAA